MSSCRRSPWAPLDEFASSRRRFRTKRRGGTGASSEGNRPFVDRFDLQTKETKRLWRSQAPYYEYPISILDPDQGLIVG